MKVGGSAFSHRLGQPAAPVQGLPQLTLALLEEGNGKETPAFRAWIHAPYARPGALQTFSRVPPAPPPKQGTIIFASFQLRVGWIREVKYLAQGHTAGEWQLLPSLCEISKFRTLHTICITFLIRENVAPFWCPGDRCLCLSPPRPRACERPSPLQSALLTYCSKAFPEHHVWFWSPAKEDMGCFPPPEHHGNILGCCLQRWSLRTVACWSKHPR